MTRPLQGIKIIEIESLGPVPFCGMHLMQLGAEVTLVHRPGRSNGFNPLNNGKTLFPADLKSEEGVRSVLELIGTADGLIEGLRPGVLERLGLGPERLCAVNAKLVMGRCTGWGQTGPLNAAAGHDINYAALSGGLWYGGQKDTKPWVPPTLIADIGGGAHYLMIGLLAALMSAKMTGQGCIVDAAMVDGAAHMMSLLAVASQGGIISETRGESLLDGAPWYNSYQCKDGHYITVGSLEPKFYALLISLLGLAEDADFAGQFDKSKWPVMADKLTTLFQSKSRQHWVDLLEGTDVCFAPVLSPTEAAAHNHNVSRQIFNDTELGLPMAKCAPRFSPFTPSD